MRERGGLVGIKASLPAQVCKELPKNKQLSMTGTQKLLTLLDRRLRCKQLKEVNIL